MPGSRTRHIRMSSGSAAAQGIPVSTTRSSSRGHVPGLVTSAGEPIGYVVRRHPRATRVSFRVCPARGVLVTCPRGVPLRRLEALLRERRDWIRDAFERIVAATPTDCRAWPPTVLDLAALDRRVEIVLDPSSSREIFRWATDERLIVRAAATDRDTGVAGILAALRACAASALGTRLQRLAAHHALSYRRMSIRAQRSRWGSCSSRGTISLNCKLLFLPPELVDYVLLHELAHTRHLDHSPAFWSTLESLAPGARALDRRLASAGRRVPPWLY